MQDHRDLNITIHSLPRAAADLAWFGVVLGFGLTIGVGSAIGVLIFLARVVAAVRTAVSS